MHTIPDIDTVAFLMSKLALGTVQFGLDYGISNTNGKTSREEVSKILAIAWDNGITMLDTAQAYGSSEQVLGGQLANPFDIVTKFPADCISAGGIRESAAASLAHLRTGKLYGLLAHDADVFIKSPGLWKTMMELKEAGVIQKAGYSLYTPAQLQALLDRGLIPDIIQLPYNFFDRRFYPFLDSLKTSGIEIHVRSAFLQGLFFMNPETLSSHFDIVKPLLQKIQSCFIKKADLAAWLLQFILKDEYFDKVIFGVNDSAQLISNLTGLQKDLHPVIETVEALPDEILLPFLWPKN